MPAGMLFVVGFLGVGAVFGFCVHMANTILPRYGLKGYRYSLPIAHTAVIGLFAILWFLGGEPAESMSLILWVIPTILDLPLTLYYVTLALGKASIIALASLVLGGAEYALIGWLIDLKKSHHRDELYPSKKTKILLGAAALIVGAILYQRTSYALLPDYQKTKINLQKAGNGHERYRRLWDAMIEHSYTHRYKKAKQYAQEFLHIAPQYKQEESNYYSDLYVAHTILGKVALDEGNTTVALQHLHASVDLNLTEREKKYFTGVNLTLANLLYKQGYREDVLVFMRKCVSLQYSGFEYFKEVETYLKRLEKGENPRFDLSIDFY